LRIEEHPLLTKSFAELIPLIKAITPKAKDWQHRRALKLSTEQRYHHYVFWYANNMVKAFSRLNHVILYVKDFPKGYLKQGVTMYDWIQYHYHVYILTIYGLYDIALNLTNCVFPLGLDKKTVNQSTVEDNLLVKSTGVSMSLGTLRKATSQVGTQRHSLIHRGDVLELDELRALSIICMDTKFTTEYPKSYGKCKYPPDAIKFLFQLDIGELTDKMSSEISSLENNVINLFDELLPVYDSRASILKTSQDNSSK